MHKNESIRNQGTRTRETDIIRLELAKLISVVVNPFRAPEPLPILHPSNFVPENGFPVVKVKRSTPRPPSTPAIRGLRHMCRVHAR